MFMQVAAILTEVAKSDTVYLYTRPQVLDFTSSDGRRELVVCSQGGDQYTFALSKDNVFLLWSLLQMSIFASGKKVIGWDLKNLFSYLRYHGQRDFKAQAALIDLKLLEGYLGASRARPDSLGEALGRVRHLFNSGAWKGIQGVYRRIHLPLLTTVIPALETAGLLDPRVEAVVHAYYEIEGAANGRLRCEKAFTSGFVPHALSEQDREALMPRHQDEIFMYFDYKSLEVGVLHWLTQDPALGEAIKTPDVYAAIYERVIGKKCGPGQRDIAKKFFLPVIYGQSASGLQEKLKVSPETANAIVNRVYAIYATATDWIGSHQQQAEVSGYARDYYGRRRDFPDIAYLSRNFMVQAPASTICLDKLITLQRSIAVAYHVHDGYVVTANRRDWKEVYLTTKGILEAPDDFYPGLRLTVNCKAGRNLNRLKPISTKGTE